MFYASQFYISFHSARHLFYRRRHTDKLKCKLEICVTKISPKSIVTFIDNFFLWEVIKIAKQSSAPHYKLTFLSPQKSNQWHKNRVMMFKGCSGGAKNNQIEHSCHGYDVYLGFITKFFKTLSGWLRRKVNKKQFPFHSNISSEYRNRNGALAKLFSLRKGSPVVFNYHKVTLGASRTNKIWKSNFWDDKHVS